MTQLEVWTQVARVAKLSNGDASDLETVSLGLTDIPEIHIELPYSGIFSRISHLNGIHEKLYLRKFIPYTKCTRIHIRLCGYGSPSLLSPLDSASLPSPKGLVSTAFSPAAIKEANDTKLASCGRGTLAAYS